MFYNKKVSPYLNLLIKENTFKKIRIIIHCSSLLDKAESKLKSYGCKIVYTMTHINCICSIVTPFALKRLSEFPFVKYLEIDSYAFITSNFNSISTSSYELPKHTKLSGKNIGVGIISTGIYPHTNLKLPKDKISFFLDLVNNLNYPYDDNGHGTFISGIISGKPRESKGDFSGIAPDSSLYSIKAFDKTGKAYVSSILFSLEVFLNLKKESNLRILFLPFEILQHNNFILSLFSKIFDKAISEQMIIIAPSGNNGNEKDSMVGINTLNNCITIGGLESSKNMDTIYNLSSGASDANNKKPDFLLPCTNIKSTNSDVFYVSEVNSQKIFPKSFDTPFLTMDGTSLCTAYACGLCALILEKNPDYNFKDVYSLFKYSSSKIKVQNYLQGNGSVDIKILFNSLFNNS